MKFLVTWPSLRVGDTCKSEYAAIQNQIRKSKWVHIDETSFHVNEKKYWLWSFRSAENDTLIVISDSRGRGVVCHPSILI